MFLWLYFASHKKNFMPVEIIPSFLFYCFVSGITPGPANLCSLSLALRRGSAKIPLAAFFDGAIRTAHQRKNHGILRYCSDLIFAALQSQFWRGTFACLVPSLYGARVQYGLALDRGGAATFLCAVSKDVECCDGVIPCALRCKHCAELGLISLFWLLIKVSKS